MIGVYVEPVRFRCKTDQWRQYRGYVFEFGRPTTVTDRASIEALSNHPDFERVVDIAKPVVTVAVSNQEETPALLRRKPGRPRKDEVSPL